MNFSKNMPYNGSAPIERNERTFFALAAAAERTNQTRNEQNIFRNSFKPNRQSFAWNPPIYRDMSLLSKPSHDLGSSFSSLDSVDQYVVELPKDFIPPRHQFSCSTTARINSEGNGGFTSENISENISEGVKQLRPTDIVCGRGAPTLYHKGNRVFRELVKSYETAYLCSKRSDKPRIAIELLEKIRSQGGRFVRREKNNGRSTWVEISEQRAYEKVCQALREGAPEIRRQMIASSQSKETLDRSQSRDKENYTPLPCFA